MGDNCNDITNDLKRGGENQVDRNLFSLDPYQLQLQKFGIKEWMQFAYNFAKDVNFFNTSDNLVPDGDWTAFFKDDTELEQLLSTYQENDRMTPHLALFICFLRLIEFSRERFNLITKRHLDFYYKEVLQIAMLPEEADKAYVLFELAKTVARAEISKGTELDGQKDNTGKKRTYVVAEDIVVNKTQVAELKNVYSDPGNKYSFTYPVVCAPYANSEDGLGKKITAEPPAWYPFGYIHTETGKTALPDAELGFSLASSSLKLQEGTRSIAFRIHFYDTLPAGIGQLQLLNTIKVAYTTEDGWTEYMDLSADSVRIIPAPNTSEAVYSTGFTTNVVTLVLVLQADKPAATAYNKAIHGEQLDTSDPVFRFKVANNTAESWTIYHALSRSVLKVQVLMKVEGIRSMLLESDTGTLNGSKPFYPFTTLPVSGSSFSIYNQEAFSKSWNNLKVSMKWKNTPDSFPEWYKAYDSSFAAGTSKNWLASIVDKKANTKSNVALLKTTQANTKSNVDVPKTTQAYTLPADMALQVQGTRIRIPTEMYQMAIEKLVENTYYSQYNSIVKSDNYFTANWYLLHNKKWENNPSKPSVRLFQREYGDAENFYTNLSVDNTFGSGETGFLKLTLNETFLHSLYPTIYALAISSDDSEVLIPNEPYTPFAEEIELEYHAATELLLDENRNSEQEYKGRKLRLFREYAFGQSEEHPYLNAKALAKPACYLLPDYNGGELYIGLKNAGKLEQLVLLVQLLEGTENPLGNFDLEKSLKWDILCSNFWKPVTSPLLLADQTDNFLRSGLVRLIIPSEASIENTLLPEGLIWLRATIENKYDTVCKLLSVSAQAALSVFDNRGNDLAHLEKGIPAHTITKLRNRNSLIKTVDQPYNSFGGKQKENDHEYYRRVSERLRHKNRAITLWDYEHLVLQHFPEIYRVKCLNHTCRNSFVSGGNVTIVVIPDVVEKNVFDIFQPRVSRAALLSIKHFLESLTSLHVKLDIINPDYEEIKVSLKVSFYEGLDIPLHLEKLNEDIKKFLSPWAYDNSRNIRFGVTLYRTVLINYIEELSYVDYLEDVSLIQNGIPNLSMCKPSSPRSILVSAKNHDIIPVDTKAVNNLTKTEEKC